MNFSFDLISDLHIETWDHFDWTHQPTSPYCIVAGDVAKDQDIVANTLEHLSQCYKNVFYIDGNDEHRNNLNNIGNSYKELSSKLQLIPNVFYLQDNVVIINGVAILATNGWWSFDMDPNLDYDQSQQWLQNRYDISKSSVDAISNIAFTDADYLINSVEKLQTHQDVRAIVVVTHTIPAPWLIDHDIELVNTWRYNCLGNKHMQLALNVDTEQKIKVWCFGHYHKSVDRFYNNRRYVNNCRGRGDTEYCQIAYYPKKITIEF